MVRKNEYVPQPGDIVWLNFSPQSGREQKGQRPAIIISNEDFVSYTGFVIACPITSKDKGFPLHLQLPDNLKTKGVVLCEHVRSLDPVERNIQFIEKSPDEFTEQVKHYLETFL